MGKFLWEVTTGNNRELVKNKYTIVYENKSFVYCKVNGTDELKRFYQNKVDNSDFISKNYILTRDEEKINIEIFNRNKKLRDMNLLEESIISMKCFRDSDLKKIEAYSKRIKVAEEQLEVLKKEFKEEVLKEELYKKMVSDFKKQLEW